MFEPYIIRTIDGVKIAFVGATTPETMLSSTPRYFQDAEGNYIYSFDQGGDGAPFYASVQQAVDDARAEGARVVPQENGAFLQCSGLTYEIHTYVESGCAMDENGMFAGNPGEYRVRNVMMNGEPLDVDRTYTVAGHIYTLIDHGDGHTAFDGAKLVKEFDETDYDVLASYIRDTLGGVVGEDYENPYGQERIVAVEVPRRER